jgi:uncharacterized SAM-binding protein YcdF (DUF218 family)
VGVLADIVKTYLVPGSVLFLLLGLASGVLLLQFGEGSRRWARRWLTGLVVLYWLLAMPLVSDLLARGLTRSDGSLTEASQAAGVTTVVVLSNGLRSYRANGQEVTELQKDTAFNALEAARVYRMVQPRWVIASGGQADLRVTEADALREVLVKLGVPADRIVLEARSTTTREQAVQTAALLGARGATRFVLVTAPGHMVRALRAFKAQGTQPIPSASSYTSVPEAAGWLDRLRPTRAALIQSDWAVYEYLARIYYLAQGWIG